MGNTHSLKFWFFTLAALGMAIVCFIENAPYYAMGPVPGVTIFISDLMVNGASRSLTWDVLCLFVVLSAWMWINVKDVGYPAFVICFLLCCGIAASVGWLTFLAIREWRAHFC